MTPIHNGPARTRPKGLTRDVAATVAGHTPRCTCPNGRGIPVVTFVDQRVTRVERRHLTGLHGCQVPTQHEQPATYLADIWTRSR
ncbi:hypothetical protein GA0070616_4380 [Micromonospora nigra]|uniref:Uncharacterized protein n=1 Tax=Micromonospora nigra TaxID=145857 RepID=A0A1C6SR63_9ACTN|nr:hypothetical protein [Micromonospora nigra]SCL32061.1 hypothetical protein GA0070616_4380 [Micromonospora nigra]